MVPATNTAVATTVALLKLIYSGPDFGGTVDVDTDSISAA